MTSEGESMTLRDKIEAFIAGGHPKDLDELLNSCVKDRSLEALVCVTRLFEDMYGGITFNFELKSPAAWELACWGKQGLDQLVAATKKNPTSKNTSLCLQILTVIASEQKFRGELLFCSESRRERLDALLEADPTLRDFARSRLIEFVLSVEDEDDLLGMVGSSFSRASWSLEGMGPAKELFAAVSTRWLTVSEPLLKRYETLIAMHSNDERAFQAFFTEHPQILDPMAAEIWPEPDLHGARRPDFVIRRFDNSYVVVEIETPAKQLVTTTNQLSSYVTHAVAQAAEYRRFIERLPAPQTHFPNLDEVSCLVVIGLEAGLNADQQQVLRNDNRQRHGLQVVGFDWLARRGAAVRENMIKTGVEVRHARVT
jgi:hypothetical protein